MHTHTFHTHTHTHTHTTHTRTHTQLVLWEGYEGECLGGGVRYQPQAIRTELAQAFAGELVRLLEVVAVDPTQPLRRLAGLVHPPFLSSQWSRSKRLHSQRHK